MRDERDPSMHTIADGVHAWMRPDGSWWLTNAGAVVTGAGIVVVDTCARRHLSPARRRYQEFSKVTGAAAISC